MGKCERFTICISVGVHHQSPKKMMWSFQVMGAGSLKGENFEGWVCLKKWTRWVCGQGRQDGAVVLPSPPPYSPSFGRRAGEARDQRRMCLPPPDLEVIG